MSIKRLAHMGAPKILDKNHPDYDEWQPVYPRESHDDGCPGAWYRSPWVLSLIPYERLLTESGFSENLHLSRCDDRLVLDAIAYLERERLAARNHFDRVRAEAQAKAMK